MKHTSLHKIDRHGVRSLWSIQTFQNRYRIIEGTEYGYTATEWITTDECLDTLCTRIYSYKQLQGYY